MDDHFAVRAGVCALLAGVADIVVVGEAEDGLGAVEEARRCEPQVIRRLSRFPGALRRAQRAPERAGQA